MRTNRASVVLGNLIATPDFLGAVPRTAMIAALRAHATADGGGGDVPVVRSTHRHEGWEFQLVTVPERECTYLSLMEEDRGEEGPILADGRGEGRQLAVA
jgi:hypothetical protein